MQEEKRVEEQGAEKREEHRLSHRKALAVAAFGALLVLASMAVGFIWYKEHALSGLVYKCGYYLLVPEGNTITGDYNVPVCYQEVNGIPAYIALCPTRIGIRASFLTEFNGELAYELYNACRSINAGVEVNAG